MKSIDLIPIPAFVYMCLIPSCCVLENNPESPIIALLANSLDND